MGTAGSATHKKETEEQSFWLFRYSKAIIGLILAFVALGLYFAFQIPTGVFPTTNFPRVIIAIDNGVMPIDEMLVSITRPVEEAVSGVGTARRTVHHQPGNC